MFCYIPLFISDDDSDTATEDEEEVRARELRKQEVRLEVPDRNSDSGSDTEVKSNTPYQNDSSLPDVVKDSNLNIDVSSVASPHTITISSPNHNLSDLHIDKLSYSKLIDDIPTSKSDTKHSSPTSTPYGTPITSPSTPVLFTRSIYDSVSPNQNVTPPLPLPRRKHAKTMNHKNLDNSNKFDQYIQNNEIAFSNHHELTNTISKPSETILSPLNIKSNIKSFQQPIKLSTNTFQNNYNQKSHECNNNSTKKSSKENTKQDNKKSPIMNNKPRRSSIDESIKYKSNTLINELTTSKINSKDLTKSRENLLDNISVFKKNSVGELVTKLHSDSEMTVQNETLNTPPTVRNRSQRLKHTPSVESEDKSYDKEKSFIPEYISTNLPSPKSSFSQASDKTKLESRGNKKDTRTADKNKKDCIVM